MTLGIYEQQRLDIQIVSGKNDFEKHLLIDSDELLVPFANVRCAFARLILASFRFGRGERLTTVVLAVLKDLKGGK